ncbi:MAG TPA: hypothetical protein VK255_02150 [Patescibacteria group bacterium]|nr:hypothetical protein [Patescibacteria group bacterium]
MNLSSVLAKLGIATSFTQDVTLLIVIALASFLFAVAIGKSRLAAVLVGSYISFALVSATPVSWLAISGYNLIAFLVIIIGITLWGKKMIDISIGGIGSGFMWKIFVMSFLEVVMILSIAVSLVPKKDALAYVSISSYGYLNNDPMRLIWMAAPLLFLFFVQRRRF